jgi:ATP-dependent helicase/DNAse subunit B
MINYALHEADRITNNISGGVTGILPVMTSPAKTPCRYCEYAALCQIDAKLPGGKGCVLPKLDKSEAIDKILSHRGTEDTKSEHRKN